MTDLQGSTIGNLTTRLKSAITDLSKAWLAFEDKNDDPPDTFKIGMDDLLSGVTAITWHATDLPAEPATKGLYGVTTGTYKGLYISNGTKTYRLLAFEEDGS